MPAVTCISVYSGIIKPKSRWKKKKIIEKIITRISPVQLDKTFKVLNLDKIVK